MLGTGSLEGVSAADVGFFVLVGAIGWTGYACFYRALAIGPISVLSPIVSGYAMVTLLLAIVLLDERLGLAAACAVVVSVVGIVLASSGLRHIFRIERLDAHGLLFALAAMVLIGAFVLGVSVKADDLGWLAPVFLARLFSTVFVFASLIKGGAWRFPDRSPRVLWAVVALALLDTAGYISFNLGTERVRHGDRRGRFGAVRGDPGDRGRAVLPRAPDAHRVGGRRVRDRRARLARPRGRVTDRPVYARGRAFSGS